MSKKFDLRVEVCQNVPLLRTLGDGMSKKLVDAGSSGEFGWHACELALRCPRLYAYKYRDVVEVVPEAEDASDPLPTLKLGFKPRQLESQSKAVGKPALSRGSLIHAGLANHYRRLQATQRGESADEWADPIEAIRLTVEEHPEYAPQEEEAAGAVRAYIANWIREQVEVLHVEEVFAAEIEGERYTQRLDLVVRERDGKVYVWDHKGVGRIDSKTISRYTLSGQFIGMRRLVHAVYGEEFGGVRLNLIESNGKGYAFQRCMVDPAPSAVRTFPLTVLHARAVVKSYSDLSVEEWPQALSEQTCMTAYGRCDYFERCRWGKQ
jgi:hypothetical protein